MMVVRGGRRGDGEYECDKDSEGDKEVDEDEDKEGDAQ